MTLPSFQHFRETGLGNMTASSDLGGQETELVNDLVNALRESGYKVIHALQNYLDSERNDPDTENSLKRIVGLIKNIQEKPSDTRKKLRDPMSNVVARAFNGADGPGTGGQGEG